MNELASFYIPRRLDEPERILIWTIDELGITVTPFIIGILYGYITTGMLLGLLAFLGWRKIKGGSINHFQSMFYWYLPSQRILGLKVTPPSYKRFFIG